MEKFLHILWIIGLVVAGIVGLIIVIIVISLIINLVRRIKFGKEYDEIKPELTKSRFLANQALLGKPKIAWILPYHDLEWKYLPDPIDCLFNPSDNFNVVPNGVVLDDADSQNYLAVKLIPDYFLGTIIGARIKTRNVSNNLFVSISRISIKFFDENHEYLFGCNHGKSLREQYEDFLNDELSKCVGSEAQARVKSSALDDFLKTFKKGFKAVEGCSFIIPFDDIDKAARLKARFFSCDLEFYVFEGVRDNTISFSRFKYVGVKHYENVELSDLYEDFGLDNDIEGNDRFSKVLYSGYYQMPYSDYRNIRHNEREMYIAQREGGIPLDAIPVVREYWKYCSIKSTRKY